MGGSLQVERAVVFLTFGGGAQCGVGVGNGDEASACSWVVWVTVWMVSFGETVEGSVLC